MIKFWFGDKLPYLNDDEVFVFGSNPEGRHGLGASLVAKEKYGAEYGVGRGHTGRAYALVTKNLTGGFLEPSTGIMYDKEGYRSVSLDQIEENIKEFYLYADENPHLKFFVCYNLDSKKLNGYSKDDFADCFTCALIPDNVYFHESFKDYLISTCGFRGVFSFLSNFTDFEKPLTKKYKGRIMTFRSNEHFYQTMKFEDLDIAQRVCDHPSKGLKKFVASMDIYQRDDWDDIKLSGNGVWTSLQVR